MSIKTIIENTDTKAGQAFDLVIQGLILVSLLCFCFETLPDLDESTTRLLNYIELFSVVVFTVEYVLRIVVADRKRQFFFSFYGIVDFLAILPFYLSIGVDLRSIRVFRMFRLFRSFKLIRYSEALRRYRQAFRDVKEELVIYSMATVFIIFLSSVGIYYFEHQQQPEDFKSVFHCLWWSIVTLTTVGYGDVYPITMGGRVFTGVILFLGLGIVAVPTALLSSALAKADRD